MGYRSDFTQYEREAYWTLPRVFLFLAATVFGFGALGTFACAVGLVGGAAQNAATVVQREFYPEALLQKYEWFKDAAAALDAKAANIGVYNARFKTMASDYGPRASWPRDVREQAAIWQSEVSGIKASYNGLAAEYNAEMAKFNWRFTNVGDVPQGGKPLPREYRPYIEE